MSQSKSSRAIEQRRKEFEAWISAGPYKHDIDRYADSRKDHFAGQYKTYTVQLAWCAWQAAILRLKQTMCNRN